MKQYELENIRNLTLLSHCGAGKTSLSEAILFTAKAISRLGKVSDGTTTSDYDPSEVKREISINLATLPYEWKENKIKSNKYTLQYSSYLQIGERLFNTVFRF